MRTFCFAALNTLACAVMPMAASDDKRVEQPHGYHIVVRPARAGETPPEAKELQTDDSVQRRRANNTEIGNRTPPTREPELKPKEIKP